MTSASPPSSDPAATDRQAAREAAKWLLRINGGQTHADDPAFLSWLTRRPHNQAAWERARQLTAELRQLPAELAVATLNRPAPQPDRRTLLRGLALLAVVTPVGLAVYHRQPWLPLVADYHTGIGSRQRVVLPDGTEIHLNSGTSIQLRFDEDAREVKLLAGEILVTTAPDTRLPPRPFFVRNRDGICLALGTRYLVRQDSASTRVAVMAGAVLAQPADFPMHGQRIEAGQQAQLTRLAVSAPTPLPADADAWTRGVLRAAAMPLGAFLDELARHRPGIIRCDPAIAGLTVSGLFQLEDTGAALEALPAILPVRVHYRTRYWVQVSPA